MSEKTAGDLIAEEATRHYKSLGVREIDVPEWKCRFYYKPVTAAEQQDILREAAKGGGLEHAYARAIVTKALDEKGERLFTVAHQIVFTRASYAGVVQRIGEALIATNLVPPDPLKEGETPSEQAEGNS